MFYPWVSDVLVWIVGALMVGVMSFMLWKIVFQPWLFPDVWTRAYRLGYADGMAGKPHHTRQFESQTANNGYSSGIDDAREKLQRREQRILRLKDAEKLRGLDPNG